jgi:hypothetical protein
LVVRLGIEMFVDGEQQLGRYQVSIARQRGDVWVATVPPLYVMATNYRLILWPQTLKPYTPASIPCTYILEVRHVDMAQRSGLMLWLKTGHRIYMLAPSTTGRSLTANIRQMVKPPKNSVFASNLARPDVLRLINFFAK